MAALQEFKCPNCDGGIEFSSGEQKMKCPYCDSEFEIESLMAYQAELDKQYEDDMTWDTGGNEWQAGEADGLRVYCCNSCGGEGVAVETTGATECPFCGHPVIMTGQFAGSLRPDLVIPFQMDKKAAMTILLNHYKGKVLLPKVFKDENHVKEVKGIYVPVWLFDADADAHVQYKTTRIRHWSDSNYRYTETNHYMVTRAGDIGFQHVPVDGSSKMDDTLMESIEPFDIRGAVDFRTAYLSGYLADKYDVDAAASSSNIKLNNSKAKYALFPVWMLNTQWKGKKFTFAINGQTGKIAGDLPMDMGAFWRWLLGVSGAVSAAVFAISYLSWLV